MKTNIVYHLICLITLLFVGNIANAQKKFKSSKAYISWGLETTPQQTINSGAEYYSYEVKSELNPIYQSDVRALKQSKYKNLLGKEKEAKIKECGLDTLDKLANKYLSLKPLYSYNEPKPDIIVKLINDQFEIANVQLDVDPSDPESIICEAKISALLTVASVDGDVYLEKRIYFTLPDQKEGEPTYIRLEDFLVSPTFKQQLRMTKKPEKRKKVIEKKLLNYQADMIRGMLSDSRVILQDQFLGYSQNFTGAIYKLGVKEIPELEESTEKAATEIKSLLSLSKKKRKTFDEVKPVLAQLQKDWEAVLPKMDNPELLEKMHANLATVAILQNNADDALKYSKLVPAYAKLEKSESFMTGSMKYNLMQIDKSIKALQRSNGRTRTSSLAKPSN